MLIDMKTILVFGDSNTWGAQPVRRLGVIERHPFEARWTSVAQRDLGDGYRLIPEGLNARTTVFDDPIDGIHKSGRRYLTACLETHMPLDLVIVALGTNDTKTRFAKTAFDVATGAAALLDMIANPPKPLVGGAPARLLVSPPRIAERGVLAEMFAGAEAITADLAT
ncbi:MAG: GDSL-type esterase/lipase family protein, partial [Rhodospirillaceae bacterium]